MDKIYCDLSLDFSDNRTLQTVRLKQYDKYGKRIRIKLYDNGEPVAISADDTTVSLYASVNKTILAAENTDDCGITETDDGYGLIYISVGEYLTSIAGTVKCDVRVTSEVNGRVHTATFYLSVEPSAVTTDMSTAANTSNIFDVIDSEMSTAATELQESLSKYILYAINGLNPNYEYSYFTTTVSDTSTLAETPSYYSLSLTEEEFVVGTDGLIITVNDVVISTSYFTITRYDEETVRVTNRLSVSTGDVYKFYVYHKPTSSTTATYGTATAVTEGTTVSVDGTATATTTGTTVSVYGVAEKVEDEDSNDNTE
ncbi:MAG: phage baseplate upper protein [Clostridia bacterium]|nr:phage baseplate upper protein [Clostridia bacterium]